MPTVFVIPIRSFRLGKKRLAGILDEAARERLSRALARHVAETVLEAGHLPLIVTADPEVTHWAEASGYDCCPDPDRGLDVAAGAGVAWALESGRDWVVLHADLPLVGPRDLMSLAEVLIAGNEPISPSSDGGTSAIGGRDRFEFSFGDGSFHRHLGRMRHPRVVSRTGLGLDIDSPADLDAAMNAGWAAIPESSNAVSQPGRSLY